MGHEHTNQSLSVELGDVKPSPYLSSGKIAEVIGQTENGVRKTADNYEVPHHEEWVPIHNGGSKKCRTYPLYTLQLIYRLRDAGIKKDSIQTILHNRCFADFEPFDIAIQTLRYIAAKQPSAHTRHIVSKARKAMLDMGRWGIETEPLEDEE